MVALRIEDTTERRTRRRITRRREIGIRTIHIVRDPLPLVRRDTLPEQVDYRDNGCDLYASCLRCPLARCQYDIPESERRRFRLDARDREIARLRDQHRAPVALIASTYGLTPRTVFHILSQQRAATANTSQLTPNCETKSQRRVNNSRPAPTRTVRTGL